MNILKTRSVNSEYIFIEDLFKLLNLLFTLICNLLQMY